MSKSIRISDEAYQALRERAREEHRTVTAVIDRWVAEWGPASAPVESEAEPTCARCGHPARKHTPACYHAGCGCRKVA